MTDLSVSSLPPELVDQFSKMATPAHVAQTVTSTLPEDAQWRPARHLEYLNGKLIAKVTDDTKQTFLGVSMSVRSGKSELISKYLPVWYLGMYPDRRVILVSYNEDKAAQWAAEARNIMAEWGLKLFGISVDQANASKTEWGIRGRKGGMVAVGITGSLTGGGADLCFASGTLVSTPQGEVPIDTIARNGGTVWAYDFHRQRAVASRVVAATESEAPALVDVLFTSGRTLRCTPDHPLYVKGRGWTEAGLVPHGAEIPCVGRPDVRYMQDGDPSTRVRVGESGTARPDRSVVFDTVRPGSEPERPALRNMQRTDRPQATTVLPAVCHAGPSDTEIEVGDMPVLRDSVPTDITSDPVLFENLREPYACSTDDRGEQPAFHRRAQLLESVQRHAPHGVGTGRPQLRRVWRHATTGGPSLRRGRDQQHGDELGDVVHAGSHEAPQVSCDTVSVVTAVLGSGSSHTVFDIQVADYHNLFAEGVLAHNCIVDDPIKNDEEAESAADRKKKLRWYNKTLRTRLSKRGSLILTMARWHEDDLVGALKQGQSEFTDPWDWITMPAIAEAPKDAGPDWRDEIGRAEGEALWPEEWPLELLYPIRAGDRATWDSLYQQNPTSAEGGMFKVANWRYVPGPAEEIVRTVRVWDTASKENAGDWTVGVLMGMGALGRFYVLDVIRGQWDSATVERTMRSVAALDGRAVAVRFERGRNGESNATASNYIRLLAGFDVDGIRAEGNKTNRARPLAAQQTEGNVALVTAHWNAEYVEEFRAFDKGKHDDQVDASVHAFNFLTEGGTVSITADELGEIPLAQMARQAEEFGYSDVVVLQDLRLG